MKQALENITVWSLALVLAVAFYVVPAIGWTWLTDTAQEWVNSQPAPYGSMASVLRTPTP